MVAQAYNPNTQRKQEDRELKAKLDYIARTCLRRRREKKVNTMLDTVTAKRRFLQFIKVVGTFES